MGDLFRNFGAVPVSGRVLYKLMKMGCSTLLYPGGAREALHRKVFKLLDKSYRYRTVHLICVVQVILYSQSLIESKETNIANQIVYNYGNQRGWMEG